MSSSSLKCRLILQYLLRHFSIVIQIAPVRSFLSCTEQEGNYCMPSAMLVAGFFIRLGDEG